uniref:Integrase zinc-binding domain-containing protein n=1 Tax=Triticum urartu TaxID=4572 RepID=A0A8R7PQX6_TRIUA
MRVKNLFYWPGMKLQVEEFVKQCSTCQHAKHEHTHPAGALQPLPIPARVWGEVTMDFIEGLPKSEGADVILVVVDRLSKYAHF